MLEVIDKGSSTESHPVPLLFVHGASIAAWCWDEHFLDFFAEKGYRAVALSFRGHGASSLSKPLKSCSIADYVDDVRAVVGKLGVAPVLIGDAWCPSGDSHGTGNTKGITAMGIPLDPPAPLEVSTRHHRRQPRRYIQHSRLGP
jgi:hypothetical protein